MIVGRKWALLSSRAVYLIKPLHIGFGCVEKGHAQIYGSTNERNHFLFICGRPVG